MNLHEAVYLHDLQTLRAAFSRGDDFEERDSNGHTLLHLAAILGRGRIVAWLLRCHVDVNKVDWEGCTPLHHAVVENHPVVVRLLLRSKARSNIADKNGRTSRDYASLKRNIRILHLMSEQD